MKARIFFLLLLLGYFGYGSGAADFDVEQVKSPYVEKMDVGQFMSAENTVGSHGFSNRHGCITCRPGYGTSNFGTGGKASSSSYSSGSSYSYGGVPNSGSGYYMQTPSHRSSGHEYKKEEKFRNGQKVYDNFHEKRYQDGKLVDEKRYENGDKDFPFNNRQNTGYPSHSAGSGLRNSAESSYSSHSSYGSVPQSSNPNNAMVDYNLNEDHESRIRRLQEELRRNTLGSSYGSINPTTYGNSHRSEFKTESRYVNGKPVFYRNEERKYKDGSLIHNVTEEKGPNELGTADVTNKYPYLTSPTGGVYTNRHREHLTRQNSIPGYDNPEHSNTYNPSEFRSTHSSSSTISKQGPYYRPASSYSSEAINERQHAATQTSDGYHTPNRVQQYRPSTNYSPYNTADKYYNNKNSYEQPKRNFETTTPTATRPIGSNNYIENRNPSSETRYPSRSRYTTTQRPRYNSNTAEHTYSYEHNQQHHSQTQRPYRSGPGTKTTQTPNNIHLTYGRNPYPHSKGIEEASQYSYFETQNKTIKHQQPHDVMQNKGYRTRYSESRETESKHSAPDTLAQTSPISKYQPGATRNTEHRENIHDQKQRYDISPYDDASLTDKPDSDTQSAPGRNRPRPATPDGPAIHPNRNPTYGSSNSYSHEESKFSNKDSTRFNYQPNVPQRDNVVRNYNHHYNRTEMSSVLPSRWVETRTTWKYVNGRLVSETQYHKYFENGIRVHENTTERTREQMKMDGVDVLNLDLTSSELAQYGTTLTSNSHSQKHELHQIKRFRNGEQVYELNHESHFQDGELVDERKNEKNEDDFQSIGLNRNSHHLTKSQHLGQQALTQTYPRNPSSPYYVPSSNEKGYTRRHELRQEEEYINGQKVYNLHHEKEYKDGRLLRENKTELGPDDLGNPISTGQRIAVKDLISGRTQATNGHQRTSDNLLTTTCLTCATGHHSSSHHASSESSSHTSGSLLGTLYKPQHQQYNAGSTFRQDSEVEEHYENGQLVKGKEETKKWLDGDLVDAKSRQYYDGPSRLKTKLNSHGSSASVSSGHSSTSSGRVSAASRIGYVCEHNPCLNSGTCKDVGTGPICVCPFGFRGAECEEAYCPSRYCRYGGSCSISYHGKHECACQENYSGYRCSTKTVRSRIGVHG